MLTLNEIAADLGVSLQTIYNRKTEAEQRLGRKIEGQPHPTDKRKIVYDAASIELITGQPIPPAAAAVEVTVETGNHCNELALPEFGGLQFSLESFRSDDVEALIFENPEALANQFLAVADQLVNGMEVDIQQREQRLQATRKAQGKIAEKA
jgi:hypothetical protein